MPQYTNPSPTGVVQIGGSPTTTETVIAGMDATNVRPNKQCTVSINLWISMSQSGVSKASVARLRDGGPTGTILAQSNTFPDQGDSAGGHVANWAFNADVTPTTNRLCVTIQATSSSPAIYSDTRTFVVGDFAGTPFSVVMPGTSTLAVAGLAPGLDFEVQMGGQWLDSFRLDPLSGGDPVTGSKNYRVLLVDMYGNQYGEVENADLSPVKWSVNGKGTFDFTVAATDPKVQEISIPEREVQVWRAGRLLWWGVIIRARADTKTVTFQCQTVEWYFDRRLFGAIPRLSLFGNGIGKWTPKVMPGSTPKALPVKSPSDDYSLTGNRSMALSASGGRDVKKRSVDDWFTTKYGANLSSDGNSSLTNIVGQTFSDQPMVTVNVYTDNTVGWGEAREITQAQADAIRDRIQQIKPNARVKATGMGRKEQVATNQTPQGRSDNRRIVISYRNNDSKKGHQQFVSQTAAIVVPKRVKGRLRVTGRAWVYITEFEAPAANNWGLVVELQDQTKPSKNPALAAAGYKKVYQRAYIPISRDTPRETWFRMEASVMVPSDGKTYNVEMRLFPPSGMAYFDEADMYTDDFLNYVNDEQAQILRDLVDHAQDPEMNKTPLNIEKNIQDTGVMRTRKYLFSERGVIGDAMNEFTSLGEGMEWEVVTTPTRRILTSYFPRKQRYSDYVLVLGQNILDFSADVDANTTSNQVVVMANEVEAYAREERSVTDLSLIDGISMEMAYLATPGSSISSLQAQARRGIERYRKATTVPTVTTNPEYVDELLEEVTTGTVLNVDVRTGWFQTVAKYRVLDVTLNPTTEQFQYSLMPEDTPIRVLSNYNSQWRYRTQAQSVSTGAGNGSPVETHQEWAARDLDDSGWAIGTAGFGWYVDGTSYSQLPTRMPDTAIPVNHEVWMRKNVLCTEEMYVQGRFDKFAYIYINGNLLNNRHYNMSNFGPAFAPQALRVPQDFLDISGVQQITVHVQDRLKDQSEGKPRSLYADLKVRGIYDRNHVGVNF